MSFICLDNVSHRLVDIVYDRRKSSLEDYFLRYSRQARNSVETICMDMYTPYITLANKLFPQANIIIDRFHIVQALNRELNNCRVAKMNIVRYANHRLHNKYKQYWKVLLAKEDKLHYQTYTYYCLFDWVTNTQGIANYLLNQDKVLAGRYRVVHDLRNALHCNRLVEGANNKIRVLKRGTYDDRNYHNFRDCILLTTLLTTRLYVPEDKKIVQAA